MAEMASSMRQVITNSQDGWVRNARQQEYHRLTSFVMVPFDVTQKPVVGFDADRIQMTNVLLRSQSGLSAEERHTLLVNLRPAMVGPRRESIHESVVEA